MNDNATGSVCSLCLEESSAFIVLSACLHRSCQLCLTKWVEREEASGQSKPPVCPFCRLGMSNEDIVKILGRAFQPKQAETRVLDQDMDDLTMQWLNDNSKECPNCKQRVEKNGGCDHMTCRPPGGCGHEWWWSCGCPYRGAHKCGQKS